jgi:hypothetical protein
MNDTEMTQEQKDAAVIESMQQHIAKKVYEDHPQGDMFLISTNMRDIIEYALAERRERMRLTVERDFLRALLDGVPQILDDAIAIIPPDHSNGVKLYRDWQGKAAYIRHALAAPADGSADADAGAADGSEVGR